MTIEAPPPDGASTEPRSDGGSLLAPLVIAALGAALLGAALALVVLAWLNNGQLEFVTAAAVGEEVEVPIDAFGDLDLTAAGAEEVAKRIDAQEEDSIQRAAAVAALSTEVASQGERLEDLSRELGTLSAELEALTFGQVIPAPTAVGEGEVAPTGTEARPSATATERSPSAPPTPPATPTRRGTPLPTSTLRVPFRR